MASTVPRYCHVKAFEKRPVYSVLQSKGIPLNLYHAFYRNKMRGFLIKKHGRKLRGF